MTQRLLHQIVSSFWQLSPILIPAALILAMWRLWSHQLDFTVRWPGRLLQLAIVAGLIALVAVAVAYVVQSRLILLRG